ncbi:MAG TPA: hypothetical protein VF278_14275 [Pirellulales bacterium]
MPFPFDATLKEILSLHPEDCAAAFGLPRDMPARLHLYNAAFYLRFHVPVRSVLVLLRPKADGDQLTGRLAYTSGGKRVEFEYDIVRMWQQSVEAFLRGGLGLLPLATLCHMPQDIPLAEALGKVVQEIDRRLLQECERPQAVRLMTAAFILTGLRVKKEDLASIYEGVRVMHESTAYDMAVEEGCVKNSHRVLMKQGRKLFGSPESTVESALTSIQDVERLERMAEAILTAKSWDELLSTP